MTLSSNPKDNSFVVSLKMCTYTRWSGDPACENASEVFFVKYNLDIIKYCEKIYG